MATKPFQPSSHAQPTTNEVDFTPLLAELRRIGDLLDARLPASAGSGEPTVSLKPGPAPIPLDAAGEKVFEALRAWRLERARKDGLSPYIVAYDRSLRQVARERPASLEDLQGIQGFGPAKAIKYGPELLEVLAKAD
ncbi:MAG TPA: HRDC domain-containing protein [Candidatus Thermoplasmatota archaeon]|nr:HRDC domain-containing protein [Candidatus Thermoplasmatota archaeon]